MTGRVRDFKQRRTKENKKQLHLSIPRFRVHDDPMCLALYRLLRLLAKSDGAARLLKGKHTIQFLLLKPMHYTVFTMSTRG